MMYTRFVLVLTLAQSAGATHVAAAPNSRRQESGKAENHFYVFVLGGPGVGKGTQCEKLKEEFGFKHISTGDLLRAEAAANPKKAKEYASIFNSGALMSDEDVLRLLKKEILQDDGQTGYLIDGYPRHQAQLDTWEKEFNKPSVIISLEATEQDLMERILGRAKKARLAGNRPRSDDNRRSAKQRLNTFAFQSKPIFDRYKGSDILKRIDAQGSPEEIFKLTREAIRPFYDEYMAATSFPKFCQKKYVFDNVFLSAPFPAFGRPKEAYINRSPFPAFNRDKNIPESPFPWGQPKPKTELMRQALLKSIDKKTGQLNPNYQDKYRFTILHHAIFKADRATAKWLLANDSKQLKDKLNVNLKDIDGYTPLMTAIFWNEIEVARLLIETDDSHWKAPLDLDMKNKYGQTYLQHAEEKGRPEIVKMLKTALQKNVIGFDFHLE